MTAIHKLEPRTGFKDGDDGGEFEVFEAVTIRQVSNGWMITASYEDGSEIIEVFDNDGNDNGDLQVIKAVVESLGLDITVKPK